MNKIFIAYGTGDFKESLHRIAKEAKKLGLFTKVITYTDKDMPSFINANPLKAYKRGDGYWVWKPYIIWQTMQEYPNSIVVYADSGNVLHNNFEEWREWFDLMNTYDTLSFQYRSDYNYKWENLEKNQKSTNLEYCKKSMIDYFEPMIGTKWLYETQCWGGLVLACRNSKLIKMWMDITLMRPDLVIDSFGAELINPHPVFGEHRHDQSIFTAVSFYWQEQEGNVVKILPETAESQKETAAVGAFRKRRKPNPISKKKRIVLIIKNLFGENNYFKIRSAICDKRIVQRIILNLERVNK